MAQNLDGNYAGVNSTQGGSIGGSIGDAGDMKQNENKHK